ncbi:MAG: ATP-dependent helicase [Caldilineaceae bacterium]
MLDLLSSPHRNYMAVGDDDQTIYEWRGADPSYILSFAERYQAKVYLMTENFRCMASQIVLANAVIRQNSARRAKQIQLTQGFAGSTTMQSHDSLETMGLAMVQRMQGLQQSGVALKEMVVLVRIYAQTPPIEQQLILHKIPYEIVGSVPFYMRSEVKTLIAYCRLAYLEKLRKDGTSLLPVHQEQWRECWFQVYWQPARYLKKEVAKSIADSALRGTLSLANALALHAEQVTPSVGEKLNAFAADLTWLMQAFPGGELANNPAAEILQELDKRLGYSTYLSKNSGFAETGADRAATIEAFIRYARNQGTLLAFLQGVKKLSEQNEALNQAGQSDKLIMTTIFRAKGLEWPHVFLPNCNDQILPYKLSHSTEEERRLLYVAITRARLALYLDCLKEEPLSPFLREANYASLLPAIQAIAQAAHKPPTDWNDVDLRAIAIHAPRLGLDRYFSQWWRASAADKQVAAQWVIGCYQSLQQRGLLDKVGVSEEQRQPWQIFLAAGVAPRPFTDPGMERWLDELERRFKPHKTNPLTRLRRTAETQAIRDPLHDLPPLLTATALPSQPAAPARTARWQRGDRVRHAQHGSGQITTVSTMTGEIWVKFDGAEVPRTVKAHEITRLS